MNTNRLPNQKAISHAQAKTLITGDIQAYHHALAFTVSRLAQADMLAEIKDGVDKAIKDGLTEREFRQLLTPYLVSKGWLNADPAKIGKRLDLILQTNRKTAYAAAKWQRIQATKNTFPYLKYMPSLSVQKRDEHTKYYGIIRHVDDPIWRSIYPPNSFNCKCYVKRLTEKEAQKEGVSDDETVKNLPKPDFDTNHDRLTALLRLAQERHGVGFANNLTLESLQRFTGIDKTVFFKSSSKDDVLYPKEKLEKLLKAFDKQNIPYLIGDEGERFAKQMGAEAVYFPTEVGLSGFFAFPNNPTRTQVIEELLHYGQHKSTNFASLEWRDIVQFEIEAQRKLLTIGTLLGWTVTELEQIQRALNQWQAEWENINDN